MRYETLYERLIANSKTRDDQNENGCWEWTGRTDGKRWAYGRLNLRIEGKHTTRAPHRLMFEIIEGRTLHPDDETVEHRCYNRLCINPDHLILLTRVENSVARWQRGS